VTTETITVHAVVHVESIVLVPAAPDISAADWEFPATTGRCSFERPATTPGSVTVGLKVEAFAGEEDSSSPARDAGSTLSSNG
jgi:hypothetical protein